MVNPTLVQGCDVFAACIGTDSVDLGECFSMILVFVSTSFRDETLCTKFDQNFQSILGECYVFVPPLEWTSVLSVIVGPQTAGELPAFHWISSWPQMRGIGAVFFSLGKSTLRTFGSLTKCTLEYIMYMYVQHVRMSYMCYVFFESKADPDKTTCRYKFQSFVYIYIYSWFSYIYIYICTGDSYVPLFPHLEHPVPLSTKVKRVESFGDILIGFNNLAARSVNSFTLICSWSSGSSASLASSRLIISKHAGPIASLIDETTEFHNSVQKINTCLAYCMLISSPSNILSINMSSTTVCNGTGMWIWSIALSDDTACFIFLMSNNRRRQLGISLCFFIRAGAVLQSKVHCWATRWPPHFDGYTHPGWYPGKSSTDLMGFFFPSALAFSYSTMMNSFSQMVAMGFFPFEFLLPAPTPLLFFLLTGTSVVFLRSRRLTARLCGSGADDCSTIVPLIVSLIVP